jgi:hypothetical protein
MNYLMKLIMLSILLIQVFTLQDVDQSKVESEAERKTDNKQYYLSWSPVYYDTYYYWDYWSDWDYWWPGVYFYDWDWYYIWRKAPEARKSGNASTTKTVNKEFKEEDAKKQLSELKKEIWADEKYSTDVIRKDKKAYDPKWLLAQLRIARALELEDMIKNPPKEKTNEKTKVEKKEKKLREEVAEEATQEEQ